MGALDRFVTTLTPPRRNYTTPSASDWDTPRNVGCPSQQPDLAEAKQSYRQAAAVAFFFLPARTTSTMPTISSTSPSPRRIGAAMATVLN